MEGMNDAVKSNSSWSFGAGPHANVWADRLCASRRRQDMWGKSQQKLHPHFLVCPASAKLFLKVGHNTEVIYWNKSKGKIKGEVNTGGAVPLN